MLDLRNEFIMATVKTGYGNKEGFITPKHLNFYKARSKHIGAIIPEPLYLDKGLRELPTQIGIDTDDKLIGLKELTDVIHQNRAKAIAHLNHPGRMVNPKIPGNYCVSSSDKVCENGGAIPTALDNYGMEKIKNLFTEAAIRAEKSGFDYIEIQFGHGYLFGQFISKDVNDRKDQYGGSFENRIKFPLEVLDAVKQVTNLGIIARISGDEMTPKGIKIDEMQKFSKILAKKGISAIHVSAGTACSTPPWFFQHMFVPKEKTWQLADKIREVVTIPVIYVGQINEFKDIDKIKLQSKNSFIAVGRPLVADPDFVGKYLGKVKGNLRPCLACSEGCLGGVKSGKGLGCTVNPLVGKEYYVLEKTQNPKNIAVIGGGLAGMTAALTLKQRGHEVKIFEKKKLGGQFNLAHLPPHKHSLIKLVQYLTKEIADHAIEIIYKEAITDDLAKYDEIVIATGSVPQIAPIEGLKEYFWAEVLEEHNIPKNTKSLVIGGGLIGTEIASMLLSKANKVIMVEMMDEVARGMEMIERKLTLKALKNKDVNIFTNTRVKKISGKKVYIEGDGFKKTLKDIDLIILATGMKSYNPFSNGILNKRIYIVGDANKVGKAQDVIEDAFQTANTI